MDTVMLGARLNHPEHSGLGLDRLRLRLLKLESPATASLKLEFESLGFGFLQVDPLMLSLVAPQSSLDMDPALKSADLFCEMCVLEGLLAVLKMGRLCPVNHSPHSLLLQSLLKSVVLLPDLLCGLRDSVRCPSLEGGFVEQVPRCKSDIFLRDFLGD